MPSTQQESAPTEEIAPQTAFTSCAAIRRLPRVVANELLPVDVEGVVIWHAPSVLSGFIIHDGGEAIYVALDLGIQKRWVKRSDFTDVVRIGARLRIKGATEKGEFAPIIVPRQVEYRGEGPLPDSKLVTLADLLTGIYDAQRVEIEGVVRSVKINDASAYAWMEVADQLGSFVVGISDATMANPLSLVDARIRVKGASLSLFNSHGEIVGAKVETNSISDLTILKEAVTDPFELPRVSLSSLRPFSPEGPPLHRCRVSGVVTASRARSYFFLQEDGRAVQVFTASEVPIAAGDFLDAVGFVSLRGGTVCMDNAIFRKKGTAPIPDPVPVTRPQLLAIGVSRQSDVPDYNGRLVRLGGTLVSIDGSDRDTRLVIATHDRTINATLDAGEESRPKGLEAGCIIEATGIASLTNKGPFPALEYPRPNTVGLVMRSFDDLRVVKAPPWWTPRRLGWLVVAVSGFALALLLWNWTLHRQVVRQSNELFVQKRAVRDAELERESVYRERDRLAGEFHDGLQQWLATVSYHVNAAAMLPPLEVHAHLLTAKRGLTRAQEELRRSLWCLRDAAVSSGTLNDALLRAMQAFADWTGAEVRVEEDGHVLHLPAHVRAGLVLVAQEAVGNALRHGKARNVCVLSEWNETGLRIAISDDGCGFAEAAVPDDGSHFGLNGMRARLRRLGGSIAISSRREGGTTVTATLSREALEIEGAVDPSESSFLKT